MKNRHTEKVHVFDGVGKKIIETEQNLRATLHVRDCCVFGFPGIVQLLCVCMLFCAHDVECIQYDSMVCGSCWGIDFGFLILRTAIHVFHLCCVRDCVGAC